MQSVFARVINLSSRSDRWQHMQPLLQTSKLDIQRFDAIQIDDVGQYLARYAQCQFTRERKDYAAIKGKGAVGCYLSHLSVWKNFLQSDKQFCLVLEDDIRNDTQLDSLVAPYLQTSDWEVGLLGWMPAPLALNNAGYAIPYPQSEGYFGAHAYILTRKAAERLVHHALPIEMQVDYYIQSVAYQYGLRIKPTSLDRVKQCYTGGSDVFTLCLLCSSKWIYVLVLFLLLVIVSMLQIRLQL